MIGPDYTMISTYLSNIEDARENPSCRKDFVKSWAERTGVSFEILWHSFCHDDEFAVFLAVDPRRQTQHEQIAADWIGKLPGVKNFKKLSSGGSNSKYLEGGRVVLFDQLTNRANPKSIDFSWEMDLPSIKKITSLSFFASHKYTSTDGGSQDNQYKDLFSFTQEAAKLQTERGVRFLAIADGHYYEKMRKRNEEKYKKIDDLKKIAKQGSSNSGTQFVQALSCKELPFWMAMAVREVYEQEKTRIPQELLNTLSLLEN